MNFTKNPNIPKFFLILCFSILYAFASNTYANQFDDIKDTKISIIINPGHGGSDFGATGITGLKEKDFNLYLSFALKNILREDFHVYLTRSSDYFSDHLSRSNQANMENIKLFISIHSGALFTQNISNNIFIGYCRDINAVVSDSTIDNIYTKYTEQSFELAQILKKEFEKNEKQAFLMGAPFLQLSTINTPSVIIETGNLNSPVDSIKMKNPDEIEKLAQIIAKGIRQYFNPK